MITRLVLEPGLLPTIGSILLDKRNGDIEMDIVLYLYPTRALSVTVNAESHSTKTLPVRGIAGIVFDMKLREE